MENKTKEREAMPETRSNQQRELELLLEIVDEGSAFKIIILIIHQEAGKFLPVVLKQPCFEDCFITE